MEKYMSGKSDREKEYVYRVLDAGCSGIKFGCVVEWGVTKC